MPANDASSAGEDADPQPEAARSPRGFAAISVLLTAAMLGTLAFAASRPLSAGALWLTYVQDDCFYYLKVAGNLAAGHGSTFNGLVTTNGYHPLWLLCLALFRVVFPHGSFIVFIVAVAVMAALATYVLALPLLQVRSAPALATNALAVFVAAFSMPLFFTGMEVILTIPLVLLFLGLFLQADLRCHEAQHAFGVGVLASAMILSRIDSILLVMLLGICLALHPALRVLVRRGHVVGFALGLLPLLAYFLFNHLAFDTWLPISGMAKQLKTGLLPASQPWHSLYLGPVKHFISFVPIVFALAVLPGMYRRLSSTEQVLYPVVLVWPFAYILMISLVSDWPLWGWYFYPFRPALCIAFAVLLRWQPVARGLRYPVVSLLLVMFALSRLYTVRWTAGDMPDMVDIGRKVQQFALTHPGVYAMGDRAGSVGYLLPNPLVQTEGLVMDRAFFEQIRRSVPLRDALTPHHVSYYVATEYAPYGPCYHAAEPSQAGPRSPHMTADFCGPVAVFDQGGMRTLIFDLQAHE